MCARRSPLDDSGWAEIVRGGSVAHAEAEAVDAAFGNDLAIKGWAPLQQMQALAQPSL